MLSAYDDLIENNNRRIALLEIMAEKLYREWFVRMRFPEHEKTKFNKGIPEGWEPVPLASQAAMIMGQSPKSEFYNTKGEGLPFHQGVGSYGKRFPKTELYCSVKGRVASRGSILFSVRAPVGRINIADCEMIIGRGLAAINHTGGYNSYLLCMLKNYFSSEDIIGNGAIFNSVSRNELHKFPILLPTIDLIKKFEKIVGSIDSKIELHFSHIKNLTKSRDKLLSRLISGKLSVEGLDIRFPASMQDQAEASPLQEKRCA